MIDLDQLLAEASESPPCGPDLEYDAAFLELEQAARGKPEQQYGDTLVPAEEPAWPQVRRLAEGLLGRSKDLRIAALFTQALVTTEGFPGLKAGCDILNGLIERYWEQVHPQLDPDDEDDDSEIRDLQRRLREAERQRDQDSKIIDGLRDKLNELKKKGGQ